MRPSFRAYRIANPSLNCSSKKHRDSIQAVVIGYQIAVALRKLAVLKTFEQGLMKQLFPWPEEG